jgi:hypothetical protein
MPNWAWLLLVMAFVPVVLYLPTHCVLANRFEPPPRRR